MGRSSVGSAPGPASHLDGLYEQARRHGYGHEKALECLAEGNVSCWCGCPTPCVGGAQRFVGCGYVVTPEHPDGAWLPRGAAA